MDAIAIVLVLGFAILVESQTHFLWALGEFAIELFGALATGTFR